MLITINGVGSEYIIDTIAKENGTTKIYVVGTYSQEPITLLLTEEETVRFRRVELIESIGNYDPLKAEIDMYQRALDKDQIKLDTANIKILNPASPNHKAKLEKEIQRRTGFIQMWKENIEKVKRKQLSEKALD